MLRALQHIRDAVDDRVEQPHENRLARNAEISLALALRGIGAKRQRIGIADRHQTLADEHEGDRLGFGAFRFDVGHDGRGHEQGAVFLIEPAGDFDLAHFLTGWQLDGEAGLGERLFLFRRRQKVDPDRIGRQRLVPLNRDRRQASILAHISRDHCSTS